MKKLIRWYNSWGLATKQFLFLFSATLILFFILFLNNLNEAEKLFKDQAIDDSQVLIARTNDLLDAYLDNMQNLILLLSSKNDLFDPDKEKETKELLRMYEEKNSLIAENIYLIRKDGEVYANNQVIYDIIGNPNLEHLYQLAQSNYGAISVSEPYYSPLSGKTIAYARPIMSQDHSRTLGVAVVEMNLEGLSNRLTNHFINSSQSFTIITDNNNVITDIPFKDELLPVKPQTIPFELKTDFVTRLSELPSGVHSVQGVDGPLVAVKSWTNRLGWSIIVFIEGDYFYQNIAKLNQNFWTAMLIWCVILFFGALLMTRYFTKPLRTLVAKMDRVNNIEVQSNIVVNRDDEIGLLAESYNAMMERIRKLIREMKEMAESKKQYELKMLRSQIAPHFLYNTLACVSSLAKQQKIHEVRETIKALVSLLSFNFDKSSEYVSLSEEVEGLRMYAQIQQIRYGDKFNIDINIEPSALDCKMLKLTIQPLVENAIFHGVIPSKRQGEVVIKGSVAQGILTLYVRDNGNGMNKQLAEDVLQKDMNNPSKYRFTGIGLKNVHERIRIHFGEGFGLKIGSRIGVGTVVRVKIPALPMDGEDGITEKQMKS